MVYSLIWAACGTGFAFLMTTLGAATVFLIRDKEGKELQNIILGFASGIMMAASVWSLILPAIEQMENAREISWIVAAAGIFLGSIFIMNVDRLLVKYTGEMEQVNRMVFAVILHNIPEGMAIGLAFSLAADHMDQPEYLVTATALAIGIGVQNFPEGAAVSLPLRQEGMHSVRAFGYGLLSAVVEPVFGIAVVVVSEKIRPLMPWFLTFAAGAMLYVVVDELIPRANQEDSSHKATMGVMVGFLIMMVLDVALGA